MGGFGIPKNKAIFLKNLSAGYFIKHKPLIFLRVQKV